MRIGFISEDFLLSGTRLIPGGCAYYRCMLPKNAAGPLSAFGPPAFSAELGFGVRTSKNQAQFGFDTIVMKMLMARWVPEQMRIAKALGQRILVDVDDHYDGLHEANLAYHTTDPEKNKINNRDHYRAVIEEADLLTVSTPFLHEYYKDKVNEVAMVRNGVNPNQFEARKVRNTKPVIGWVGSLGWRSNDVETASPWLGAFLEEHDLMFQHSGDMPNMPKFYEVADINPDRVITYDMRPLSQYHELLTMDVGLVLLSDIPFNHAKSTIKGLEYAASNIPFVAQGLPEYARLSSMGVGRVAFSDDDWVRHLTDLLDYKTRKKEAATQRNLTLKDHSIVARAHEWKEVFERGLSNVLPVKTMTVPYVHV